MLYTLGQAKTLVAPFTTTGGACPNNQLVTDRINEAVRRLISEGRADWVGTQRRVRICTKNQCVTLPREFESARIANVDRGSVDLFPRNYQYLEWGPGEEGRGEHYGIDLVDDGDGWPVFFDIPASESDYFLYAASTHMNDRTKKILFTGRKRNNEDILQDSGVPGHELEIALWDNGVEGSLSVYPTPLSGVPFSQITSVKLPDGRKGYVSLYAVEPVSHAMYFLGKYHPDETMPSYRRYKLLGSDCHCVHSVDMLCKVRYIPASRDDDVLLIQNLDALKSMVMAIREENAGNIQAALMLEEKANAQLARQVANNRSGDPILRVQDSFAISGYPGII